ncbi:MAG: hypothetical protein GF329_06495 [Candidatus Lokiarchaeota archaeon]|nr:hypothetical protein [Candidatus Lokiarchaeota archaeon]
MLRILPTHPLVTTKSKGEYIWELNGSKYIECVGGNCVGLITSIGHHEKFSLFSY